MKTILITLLALAGGFTTGILLSEAIGIASVLLFGRAAGFKYLPVYLAFGFACAALLVDLVGRGKTR